MRDFRSSIACLSSDITYSPQRGDKDKEIKEFYKNDPVDTKFNRNLLTTFETRELLVGPPGKKYIVATVYD